MILWKVKNWKKKNIIKNSSLFLFLVFISTLILGIGYAQISDTNLSVTGIASANAAKDVIITNIEYVSGNNIDPDKQNIEDPYLTLMTSKIELGNDLTSSITYKITVKNNGDTVATYDKAVFSQELGYDNPDIVFDISGINAEDELQPNEEKEFLVTFRYSDTLTDITNNVLNSIISFRFLTDKTHYDIDQIVFDGTNYIDTEIQLFSEENISKNFEISFDITNADSNQTPQATIVNSMLEQSPYPGFVFRLQTNVTQIEFNSPKIANKTGINLSTTNKIAIKRINEEFLYKLMTMLYKK